MSLCNDVLEKIRIHGYSFIAKGTTI